MKKTWILAILLSACSPQVDSNGQQTPRPNSSDRVQDHNQNHSNMDLCQQTTLEQKLIGEIDIKELTSRLSLAFDGVPIAQIEPWVNCLDQKFTISCQNNICKIGEK